MSQYLNYPVQILMELIWQLKGEYQKLIPHKIRSQEYSRRGGRVVSVFVVSESAKTYHMRTILLHLYSTCEYIFIYHLISQSGFNAQNQSLVLKKCTRCVHLIPTYLIVYCYAVYCSVVPLTTAHYHEIVHLLIYSYYYAVYHDEQSMIIQEQ